MARAPFIYDRTLVNLIHRFKYDGKTQLAKPFREFLFTMLVRSWNIEDIDMILPVPLHRLRYIPIGRDITVVCTFQRYLGQV